MIKPGAFDAETQRYVRAIALRFVRNDSDADDIAQDALLCAHRHAANFRGDCQYSTWLYRVTCRAALMHLRRHRRYRRELPMAEAERGAERPLAQTVASPAATPALAAECDELLAHAMAATSRMGAKYREVFELRYVAGFTETEIAATLHLPLATVKTRAFRARRAAERCASEHLAR
ncbi:MAG TPA: RNA polymerase sigma factor [Kofleriaceae bacterium]|nr:RNA polymerase sigma factor [Kofleriaceae bacterium]